MHRLETDVFIHGDQLAGLSALLAVQAAGLRAVVAGGYQHPAAMIDVPIPLPDGLSGDDPAHYLWETLRLTDAIQMKQMIQELATQNEIIWLPGAQPLSVCREKNRIRSIQLLWDRFQVKIKARLWLECDGRSLLPRLAGDAMQNREKFPSHPLFANRQDSVRHRGQQILAEQQIESTVPRKMLIEDLATGQNVDTSTDLSWSYGSGTLIRPCHPADQRSSRFWNLLLAGHALPLLSRHPEFSSPRDQLLSGLIAGTSAAALTLARENNPLLTSEKIYTAVSALTRRKVAVC